MKSNDVLAHRLDSAQGMQDQKLIDHMINVGKMAGEIASSINLPAYLQLLGYCHDAGKSDRIWQSYLRENTKKQVTHSSAGSKFFSSLVHQIDGEHKQENWHRYFLEIGQYVISAHHGLFDVINSQGKDQQEGRLAYDKGSTDYHFEEDVMVFMNEFDKKLFDKEGVTLNDLCEKAANEFQEMANQISKLTRMTLSEEHLENSSHKETKVIQTKIRHFYYSCLTRLVLSILKEADIYDSSNFGAVISKPLWGQGETQSVWKQMTSDIEEQYRKYNADQSASELNKIRTKLAEQAKSFSQKHKSGIFKLDLPTGSGKTNCALRYCLNNASKYGKRRIVYVTAFLSVLKQNVESIKGMVGDEYILEHHSNIILEKESPDDEGQDDQLDYDKTKYLVDSWESPVITTTLVQFSNTLFKERLPI